MYSRTFHAMSVNTVIVTELMKKLFRPIKDEKAPKISTLINQQKPINNDTIADKHFVHTEDVLGRKNFISK